MRGDQPGIVCLRIESWKGGCLVASGLRRVNGGVQGLSLGRNRHDG